MQPVILIVLDGFGERAARDQNAVRLARTPCFDRLRAEYPQALLDASGLAVGLPAGQMGNSEVGHLTLGAGRVVYQDLVRISRAVESDGFEGNQVLVRAIDTAKQSGRALHLLGLTSTGGVHSTLEHGLALCALAKKRGLDRVYWHAFLDGRDTPPASGARTLATLERKLEALGVGRIASAVGRYYAMDRDQRWERVAVAYDLLLLGEGRSARDPAQAIEESYGNGETDEFVKPIVVTGADGRPLPRLVDGDVAVFFNFRSDRAREISRALAEPGFDAFPRKKRVELASYVCMTQYDATFASFPGLEIAFAPQRLERILADVLATAGVRQLRAAETEKYAHVTFFFNGGVETPWQGEERLLVPSPKDVATYDQRPEMAAGQLTDEVVRRIQSGEHGFVLVNYANPDMVGHTGDLAASVQAVEVVDGCVARLVEAARARGAALLITADHGNCEQMGDEATGQPHTAHTTNPVPLFLIDEGRRAVSLRPHGALADVAPTILEILGLPPPAEMEGRSLLRL